MINVRTLRAILLIALLGLPGLAFLPMAPVQAQGGLSWTYHLTDQVRNSFSANNWPGKIGETLVQYAGGSSSQNEFWYTETDWATKTAVNVDTKTNNNGHAVRTANRLVSVYATGNTAGCMSAIHTSNGISYTGVSVIPSGTGVTTCNGLTQSAAHADVTPLDVIVAVSSGSGMTRFAKSSDEGSTWGTIGAPVAFELDEPRITAVSETDYRITARRSSTSSCYLIKTTDGGTTWTSAVTHTGSAAMRGCSGDWKDANNGIVLYADQTNKKLVQLKTTDGGTSWSATDLRTAQNGISENWLVHLGGSQWVAVYTYDDTAVTNIDLVTGYSTDDGATWSWQLLDAELATSANGQEIGTFWDGSTFLISCNDGGAGGAGGEYCQYETQISIAGGGTGDDCVDNDDDCHRIVTTVYGLVEVRTDYSGDPAILVREDGDDSPAGHNSGRLYKYDNQLAHQKTVVPCTFGTVGSTIWGYAPPGTRALAVTTDEYVLVVCTTRGMTGGATEHVRTHRLEDLTSVVLPVPGWGGTQTTRLEAATSTNVCWSTYQDRAICQTLATGVALVDLKDGVLGGVAVDPRDGDMAMTSSRTTNIWAAGNDAANIRFADRDIEANAVSVANNRFAVGSATGISVYNYTDAGARTLDVSTTSYKVNESNRAPHLRFSKDGDYLVVWDTNKVWVLNGTDLSPVYTSSTLVAGELQGCDMDLLNNYVWCVTTNRIHRLKVWDTVPTAFDLDKNGTVPDTASGIGYGDQFTDETEFVFGPPAGLGTGLQNPTFLGIDLDTPAAEIGISRDRFNWFIGTLMMLALAGGMVALFPAAMGLALGMGAPTGMILAVVFGFWPLWMILFAVIIAAAVIVFMRRGVGA